MSKRRPQLKSKKNPLLLTCIIIFAVAVIAIIIILIHSLQPRQSAPDDITVMPDVDITEYFYELPIYKCDDAAQGYSTTLTDSCEDQLMYLPAMSADAYIFAISSGAQYVAYYDGMQPLLYTRHTGELDDIHLPFSPQNQGTSFFVNADDGTILGIAFFTTIKSSGCACNCNSNSTNEATASTYHYFHNLSTTDYDFNDDDQLIIYSAGRSYATVYDSTGAIVTAYPITSE